MVKLYTKEAIKGNEDDYICVDVGTDGNKIIYLFAKKGEDVE